MGFPKAVKEQAAVACNRSSYDELYTQLEAAVAKSITDWIESADPDFLWVIDKTFVSLEDVRSAGFDYLYVTDLTVYAEGGFHFLAKEWTLARGGLTGMFTMLDQLADIILNG